jgi:hypothetical protein
MPNQPEKAPAAKGDPERQGTASEVITTAQREADTTTDKESGFPGLHWKKTVEVSGTILLIAGTVLGLRAWMEDRIDKAVEKKLSEPAILRKIAAESRPALLFDANESITADMGAGALVTNIKITQRQKDGWPVLIFIDFAHHINNPPLLTALNESARIHPARTKGFAWIFEVNEIVQHGEDTNSWIFRLEVAP